ncbi:unnamed protein product, partial [Pleuronectes platessa]
AHPSVCWGRRRTWQKALVAHKKGSAERKMEMRRAKSVKGRECMWIDRVVLGCGQPVMGWLRRVTTGRKRTWTERQEKTGNVARLALLHISYGYFLNAFKFTEGETPLKEKGSGEPATPISLETDEAASLLLLLSLPPLLSSPLPIPPPPSSLSAGRDEPNARQLFLMCTGGGWMGEDEVILSWGEERELRRELVVVVIEKEGGEVSSMDFMAMKRSQLYGMANNPYSTPQQPGGGPYPPSQPYTSPPPHRYPIGMQGRGQMMGGMQYPQQQVLYITLHPPFPRPSLCLSLIQGQLIPEVSRASRCMRRGEERATEIWKREVFRDGEHRHLGERERDTMTSTGMLPLLLPPSFPYV